MARSEVSEESGGRKDRSFSSPSSDKGRRKPRSNGRRRSFSESPRRSFSDSPKRRRSRSPRYKFKSFDRENPTPCKCIGVFGLSVHTDERQLRSIFQKCGSIEECTVVYDRRSGRSRGFGFIRYKHQSDADEARESMNGIDIDGKSIRVDYSVTRKPHSPTPGVYMGKYDDSKGRQSRRRSPYEADRGYDRDRRDRRRRSRDRRDRSRS